MIQLQTPLTIQQILNTNGFCEHFHGFHRFQNNLKGECQSIYISGVFKGSIRAIVKSTSKEAMILWPRDSLH